MSDPRPTIAMLIDPDRGVVTSLDLPDAEHVHITRLPDGTITATAMENTGRMVRRRADGGWNVWFIGPEDGTETRPAWVDCPTGGDQERGA